MNILANVAIQCRKVESKPTDNTQLVAVASVTVPYIGTIRDITIRKTHGGNFLVYGPSRLSTKEGDANKFYTTVFLASELRNLILAAYQREHGNGEAVPDADLLNA